VELCRRETEEDPAGQASETGSAVTKERREGMKSNIGGEKNGGRYFCRVESCWTQERRERIKKTNSDKGRKE